MLSTAGDPYDPRPSCTTGTDHSAKQDRRVEAGLDAAYNPLAATDRSKPRRHRRPLARRRRRSPTSASSTTASTRSSPGTTCARRAPARIPARARVGPDLRVGLLAATRPTCRSPSRRSASPTTTGSRRRPNTSDPDPAGGERRLHRLQGGRRRLDGVPHPRRDARGVRLHPRHDRAGARARDPARRRPGRLVHDRLVRPLRQVPGDAALRGGRRQAAAHRPLARRRPRRRGRHQRRPQPLLVLLAARATTSPGAGGGEATCDDMRAGCASMAPDGLPAGYDFVADAYTPPDGSAATSGTVRPAPARDEGQGHADDARCPAAPATRSAARAATTSCAAATATTASTAAPATTGCAATRAATRSRAARAPTGSRAAPARTSSAAAPGADRIDARGGGRDKVRCGPGRDKVRAGKHDKLGAGC